MVLLTVTLAVTALTISLTGFLELLIPLAILLFVAWAGWILLKLLLKRLPPDFSTVAYVFYVGFILLLVLLLLTGQLHVSI